MLHEATHPASTANLRTKNSPSSARSSAKKKLLFHYGLREEQLRRFVRDARSLQQSNWIESLIGLLERRLDNVVFRLGFARSMASARQLVNHGHVMVNGRSLTIGSAVLRVGDFIKLTAYAGDMKTTLESRNSPRLALPSYLQFATDGATDHGVLRMLPNSRHIPFEFDPRPGAEYYAKQGV